MNGKYITTQILLACKSTAIVKKDIHTQLEETLAERKRLMKELEWITRSARMIDMYLATEAA